MAPNTNIRTVNALTPSARNVAKASWALGSAVVQHWSLPFAAPRRRSTGRVGGDQEQPGSYVGVAEIGGSTPYGRNAKDWNKDGPIVQAQKIG
jgi:hypothetical protein